MARFNLGNHPDHTFDAIVIGSGSQTSLLNSYNQLHCFPNIFVTNGACMTLTSTQNPSLTYMALTARAVGHAVNELKKRNL